MDQLFKVLKIMDQMRDNYNHHSSRVAEYTVRMAGLLHLPDIEIIAAGAHLHDIGKFLLPRELLNAARKLTDYERVKVEEHTRLGWAIVNAAGYDPIVEAMVLSHHEHWNGTGYPDKLKKLEIPIQARILSICDVWEALTAQRSYRAAFSHKFAKTYIQGLKGLDFDPDLVDLFFEKVTPIEGEAE